MLAGKDKKALLDVLGVHGAIDEQEILLQLKRGPVNGLGAGMVRSLALRRGLLDDRPMELWAGLKQSLRLSWVAEPLHPRYATAHGYTASYLATQYLAAGERTLFDRWLALVPPRLEEGNDWCIALHNTINALGRDDADLIKRATSEVRHRLTLRSNTDFDRGTLGMALGLLEGNAELVSASLPAALAGWARFTSSLVDFVPWYLAIGPIGLFNLGRARLQGTIVEPLHARWANPFPLSTDAGRGLVDFSSISPELEAWWRELPENPGRAPTIKSFPSADPLEEAKLVQLVTDDPDADAPREVYADWLLERGMVRGEFIRLQLRRSRQEKLTASEREREKSLSQGIPLWLGALREVQEPVFERGFLSSCRASATTGDAGWSTLTSLTGCLPAKDTKLPALRHLALEGGSPGVPPAGIEALALPKLESIWLLGTEAWESPFLPETLEPLVKRVSTLRCPLPCATLPDFIAAWMPRLAELHVNSTAGARWDDGWQLSVRAGKKGRELWLHAASATPASSATLVKGLTAFGPGTFTRATIDPSVPPDLVAAATACSTSTAMKKVPRLLSWRAR